MTVNRILLHFNSASKQESRYEQAVRWREQAQSVVDRIESVVDGDSLRWWLPSAGSLADDKDPFCLQVLDGGFKLDIEDLNLESVAAMIVEALRELAIEHTDTADKIELLVEGGGAS